jgi:hypothetical protein
MMSGSTYPTLGLAVPAFHIIQQHVAKSIQAAEFAFDSPHTVIFAKAVQSKMKQYEVKIRRKEALMAAALDPRIKMCIEKLGVNKIELRTLINHEFTVYYFLKYKQFEQRTSTITKKDIGGASNNYDFNTRGTLMDSFMGLLDSDDAADKDNGRAGDEEPFANELERWFSHAGMNINQSSRDVCMWFKVNSHLFPRIGFMARDYLGITSTSVPSECAFSRSGSTISKRRASLGDDAVTAIQELQAFLNFR